MSLPDATWQIETELGLTPLYPRLPLVESTAVQPFGLELSIVSAWDGVPTARHPNRKPSTAQTTFLHSYLEEAVASSKTVDHLAQQLWQQVQSKLGAATAQNTRDVDASSTDPSQNFGFLNR